jgi:hypothetical protein
VVTWVLNASGIKDPFVRAKRLHEIGTNQVHRNLFDAKATADFVTVIYLRVALLCEIGKALAYKKDIYACKALFEEAKKIADAASGPDRGVAIFIDIGKAEREINDHEGACINFSKARQVAEREQNSIYRSQYMRLIDKAKGPF